MAAWDDAVPTRRGAGVARAPRLAARGLPAHQSLEQSRSFQLRRIELSCRSRSACAGSAPS